MESLHDLWSKYNYVQVATLDSYLQGMRVTTLCHCIHLGTVLPVEIATSGCNIIRNNAIVISLELRHPTKPRQETATVTFKNEKLHTWGLDTERLLQQQHPLRWHQSETNGFLNTQQITLSPQKVVHNCNDTRHSTERFWMEETFQLRVLPFPQRCQDLGWIKNQNTDNTIRKHPPKPSRLQR